LLWYQQYHLHEANVPMAPVPCLATIENQQLARRAAIFFAIVETTFLIQIQQQKWPAATGVHLRNSVEQQRAWLISCHSLSAATESMCFGLLHAKFQALSRNVCATSHLRLGAAGTITTSGKQMFFRHRSAA